MSPMLDILPTSSPTVGALCPPHPEMWGRVMDAQVCTDHTLQALPSAADRLMGCRALTFLPSALCPSFPDGGSVDTVKSLGSSQSRIFDSFIKESSFFLAMFSTRFRLVATCQSRTATPCHQSPAPRQQHHRPPDPCRRGPLELRSSNPILASQPRPQPRTHS